MRYDPGDGAIDINLTRTPKMASPRVAIAGNCPRAFRGPNVRKARQEEHSIPKSYPPPRPQSQVPALFAFGFEEVFEFAHELADIFEVEVDGGEADVGDLIEPFQPVHDERAQLGGRPLAVG
jgi:hypothetical protein